MACQKLKEQVNMRHKHAKRKFKHFKKNKRGTSQWIDSCYVPQPFGDPSHCNWFWKNYYSAIEWQERHHIAYWKSRSIALEYENNILYQYLQMYAFNEGNQENYLNSTGARKINAKHSRYTHSSKINGEVGHENHSEHHSDEYQDEKSSDENEFEFQITEEMMDFFEQSIRHKMELQKEREKEKQKEEKLKSDSDDGSAILPPQEQVGLERNKQMQLMYGKAAPMILGMETAMQLSFDRNCDLKQPKLWPNIPLKL